MNEDPQDPQDQPITTLADLREQPSAEFFQSVRHRIDRRVLGIGLITLVWLGSALVVREFLEMIFGLLGSADDGKGGSS